MIKKTDEFKGDSYIVDIVPPAKSLPYPAIYVAKRKKVRERGKVAEEQGTGGFLKIDANAFDDIKLDETARKIGRAILDDSEIVRNFKVYAV